MSNEQFQTAVRQPFHGPVRSRWGVVSDAGFLAFPYVLLLHQHLLGLTSEHLNVLMNIIAHWHSPVRLPFPRSTTIARRIGVSQRSVQRSLSWLLANGFIAKVPRANRDEPQAYDLKPLVEKLEPLALERLKLIQHGQFEDSLSDSALTGMAMQKPAKEMFKGVLEKLQSTQVEDGGTPF